MVNTTEELFLDFLSCVIKNISFSSFTTCKSESNQVFHNLIRVWTSSHGEKIVLIAAVSDLWSNYPEKSDLTKLNYFHQRAIAKWRKQTADLYLLNNMFRYINTEHHREGEYSSEVYCLQINVASSSSEVLKLMDQINSHNKT